MGHKALTISKLRAGYNELDVLLDVNIDILRGEWVLLVGPNGCGKSTFLKVIGGLLQPRDGQVNVHVFRTKFQKYRNNYIGFLKQTNNIFPALTVKENLELAAFYSEKKEFEEYEEFVFSVFPDIKDNIFKRSGLLSGGMRQKLAIGMALAKKSDLLLLDEPTAGLAPNASIEILLKIEKLKKELSQFKELTIIMVEHNYKYAVDKVTRLVGMKEGQIVIDSQSPKKVLEEKKEMEKIFFG